MKNSLLGENKEINERINESFFCHVTSFFLMIEVLCGNGNLTSAQVRRGYRDDLGIIVHIFHTNIFCDPSLEPSRRDGSNEGSQRMFLLRNRKNIFELSSIAPVIWSSKKVGSRVSCPFNNTSGI